MAVLPNRSPTLPRFHPSEEWIDAFASQCTEALWEAGYQYAARRSAAVRRVNGAADTYYERELVQDAIGDTAAGILRWDPSARSLKEHIFAAIRTRTNHDYHHANKFRHEPIDIYDDDEVPERVAEVEAALRERAPSADPALSALATERLMAMREMAASDPVVLAMLDAIEAGAITKADVIYHAQISDSTYHAARIRLGRIAKKLSFHSSRPRRLKKGA